MVVVGRSLGASVGVVGRAGDSGELGGTRADLDTADFSHDVKGEKVDHSRQGNPVEQGGTAAEVAASYVFLTSGEASYITGQIIGVTGGKPTN